MELDVVLIKLFALLSILAMVLAVVVWSLAAYGVYRQRTTISDGDTGPTLTLPGELMLVVRAYGMRLAAAIALVTTLGSLYLSEFAGFVPCELCWYQRIAAYPLAVIAIVAAFRRDRAAWTYIVPLCVIGAAVSLWHLGVERIPALSDSASCSAEASCTVRWVWEFGFVSIPLMALFAFVSIGTLAFVSRRAA